MRRIWAIGWMILLWLGAAGCERGERLTQTQWERIYLPHLHAEDLEAFQGPPRTHPKGFSIRAPRTDSWEVRTTRAGFSLTAREPAGEGGTMRLSLLPPGYPVMSPPHACSRLFKDLDVCYLVWRESAERMVLEARIPFLGRAFALRCEHSVEHHSWADCLRLALSVVRPGADRSH